MSRISTKRKAGSVENEATTAKKKAKSSAESFNMKRVRILTEQKDVSSGYEGIAYWMWRDQRVQGIMQN